MDDTDGKKNATVAKTRETVQLYRHTFYKYYYSIERIDTAATVHGSVPYLLANCLICWILNTKTRNNYVK